MAIHICGKVFVGAAVVTIAVLLVLPFHPVVALSFEAGLLVGLFLHSGHIGWAILHGPLTKED
jgi:hypothetical protein